MKIRKTRDIYCIEISGSYGKETIDQFDEYTEARRCLKEYRLIYDPMGIPVRLVSRREKKTLFEMVKEMGLTWDTHETDLYVKDCEQIRKLMETMNPVIRSNASRFICQLDGQVWIDFPFQAWNK